MFTKDFTLKTKALSEEGAFAHFEGVASPYGGDPDFAGDVIEPGSYHQAIAQQGKGYPLLFSHRQDEPIGLATIQDSRDALLVKGKLLLEDPTAQRVYLHLKEGSMKGLSIGYNVPRGKESYRQDGVRVIKEVHLHEISVVAIPCAPRAQITSIKSLGDVRYLLKNIGEMDNATFEELSEIDSELKSILQLAPQSNHREETLQALKAFAQELQPR
jgi:HK97 family phage prohead protease